METINENIEIARTIQSDFYTSNDMFQISKEKIFARSWQILSDDNQLKLNGSALPIQFVDGFIEEPLVLINNQNNINCFSNVCTHRGNLLIENSCQLNKQITCKYHGRRFDCSGKFISMPESNNMKNFPSKSDNLTQIKTKKWQQFIFGTLESDIEFDKFFSPILERVGWMPIQDFIFDPTASRDYLVKANWALYCDNYLEGFHIPFIHKDLAKTLDYSKYKSEIYPYCNLQIGIASGGEHSFDLPTESIDYGKNIAAYYFWVFPNMMFNFYPWGLSLNIVKPIHPKLTKVEFRTYIWDSSKLEFGAGSILDKVEREDEDIVEKVQKGVTSRFYKHGRFSPKMEKGVHHFHQLISQFMNRT